jgi:hypothetical protein
MRGMQLDDPQGDDDDVDEEAHSPARHLPRRDELQRQLMRQNGLLRPRK